MCVHHKEYCTQGPFQRPKTQSKGSHLPGMPVRTRNCRGTDAAVDAHSPTTGGIQDIAHWGQPFPLCAHTGQQTCAQSLATHVRIALGNPTKKEKRK